ncbi:MAG TPA: alkaline phosphatase family protein [Candidatus Acidoferrales bacterium]|jgi:phospholipase C|nr:alkaline phosphatase family protein [Candidatus Acidoferrales bacterium]
MFARFRSGAVAAALALATACSQSSDLAANPNPAVNPAPDFGRIETDAKFAKPIQHVVIIFQENRTPDNLFRGLRGADTTPSVALTQLPLASSMDFNHTHQGFLNNFAHGFSGPELGYVKRQDVQPYFTMAEQYAFADRMFQTNEGPSFPAHQYIVSGASTIEKGSPLIAAESPIVAGLGAIHTGGCDSPPATLVALIDPTGSESQTAYPCFDRPAITDLLKAKGLSWRYYQYVVGPGMWNAFDAIKHVHDSPEYQTNVIAPPGTFLTDINTKGLAAVTWITPTSAASDHAPETDGSGPSWVAAVVNAIGQSKYWDSTAIFITWDDWGGWYDHVKPQELTSYELGFRVPLVMVSPYVKKGCVSHVNHEFGSILKFAEKTFALGSLGTTDVRSDDLADCFDFTQAPRKFKKISAPLPPSHFLKQPAGGAAPDDD